MSESIRDILSGIDTEEKIGEHGFVRLVDCMPRLVPEGRTADFAVVRAARVSTGQGLKGVQEDIDLLRYLFRHRHTTPFEQVVCTFHMSMPIFVARQFIRHRTASVNEISARYTQLPDEFYIPEAASVRAQSKVNKQGGEQPIDHGTASDFINDLEVHSRAGYDLYETYLKQGVSRELARMFLSLNVHTQWYWTANLHNIFHLLGLRRDPHAQKEIRDVADAMFSLLRQIVPDSCKAFEDYQFNAMRLTSLEVEAIQGSFAAVDSPNARERSEWEAKRTKLFGPPHP